MRFLALTLTIVSDFIMKTYLLNKLILFSYSEPDLLLYLRRKILNLAKFGGPGRKFTKIRKIFVTFRCFYEAVIQSKRKFMIFPVVNISPNDSCFKKLLLILIILRY